MSSVQFEFKGSNYSYAKFYTGFGLTVTAYLLFSAFLAWHLGTLAAAQPQVIGYLAWAFALVQLACLVLSVLYFFIPAISRALASRFLSGRVGCSAAGALTLLLSRLRACRPCWPCSNVRRRGDGRHQ
jgi:hypothetical protein